MADQQARGRGRGRGRGAQQQAGAQAAAPAPAAAAAAAAAPVPAPVGRGRARGRGVGPAPVPVAAAAPAWPGRGQGAEPQPGPSRGRGAAEPQPGPSRGRGAAEPQPGPSRGRGAAGPQAAGDVAGQMARMAIGSGIGNGGAAGCSKDGKGGDVPVGRGSVRPIRDSGQVLITKPTTVSVKQGTEGTPVKLSANYFQLIRKKNWNLCKHHVDCNPAEDRTFVKKRLLGQHKKSFEGYLFDGTTLFTFVNACPTGKPVTFNSRYKIGVDENGSDLHTDYVLTLKFVGTVEKTDYQHLQIFNLVLRECMEYMKLTLIRRDYYDMNNKIDIAEHGLELYPGYATSFLQCEQEILLQAEIKYKVTRRDTVYNLFRRINEGPGNQDRRAAFALAVIGCVIMTNYNNKTYRVDDVDFDAHPNTSTFERRKRGGIENVRYDTYFKERYGIVCHDPNQPMLISRSNARELRSGMPPLVYLIPEFCIFTGLTDDMRKNFNLMKAVNQITCLAPRSRMDRLRSFNRNLLAIQNVNDRLSSWGLELARDLVTFNGRILPEEEIAVAQPDARDTTQQPKFIGAGKDANWDKHLKSNRMLQAININTWVLIVHNRARQEADRLVHNLRKAAQGMRYVINIPNIYEINRDTAGDFVRAIADATNKYHPELVMCVVPNVNADRYSAIKRKCIIDSPIPSQVILTKNLMEKKVLSVATKVAIQMNCKMGGVPWAVRIPVNNLMIIGYDVCHDPTDKRRSWGAMVSTWDRNCVRWYSNVTRHSAGEELSISFPLNVMKCISAYKKAEPDKLPDKIVIYRDGVGDGSIDHVLNIELQETKKVLEPMYKDAGKTLKIAFVIVTKRIGTRIFFGDGSYNPPPGTIVDSCITSPFKYDFFLISQSVRQGTVTPTHYNVIEDSTGFKPDHMQRLTYKLTHLYYNWSGTVRVPAPCQYAHKLAFLTAQSVGDSSTALDRLLYYL